MINVFEYTYKYSVDTTLPDTGFWELLSELQLGKSAKEMCHRKPLPFLFECAVQRLYEYK